VQTGLFYRVGQQAERVDRETEPGAGPLQGPAGGHRERLSTSAGFASPTSCSGGSFLIAWALVGAGVVKVEQATVRLMPGSGPITVFGDLFGDWNHGAQVLAGASWVAAGLMLAVGVWVLPEHLRNSWLGSAAFRRCYNGPRNRYRVLLEPVARRFGASRAARRPAPGRAGPRRHRARRHRAAPNRTSRSSTPGWCAAPVAPPGRRRRPALAGPRIDHILRPGLWRFLKDASTDTLDRELRLDEGQPREVRLARWQRLDDDLARRYAQLWTVRPAGRLDRVDRFGEDIRALSRRIEQWGIHALLLTERPRRIYRYPLPQAGLACTGAATCCPSAVSWPSWTRVVACGSCRTRISYAACRASASWRVHRRWSWAGYSSRRQCGRHAPAGPAGGGGLGAGLVPPQQARVLELAIGLARPVPAAAAAGGHSRCATRPCRLRAGW